MAAAICARSCSKGGIGDPGGGMAEKLGQDLADRIFEASRPWMLQPNPGLAFVVSALGDDAGVVGAALLARAQVIAG